MKGTNRTETQLFLWGPYLENPIMPKGNKLPTPSSVRGYGLRTTKLCVCVCVDWRDKPTRAHTHTHTHVSHCFQGNPPTKGGLPLRPSRKGASTLKKTTRTAQSQVSKIQPSRNPTAAPYHIEPIFHKPSQTANTTFPENQTSTIQTWLLFTPLQPFSSF